MGGNSAATPQSLGGLFGANPGYQQPNQVAPMQQPMSALPAQGLTAEQAAAATQARMQMRSPMAAPAGAPKSTTPQFVPHWQR